MEQRFSAKVLEKVNVNPGCWDVLRVGVFDGEQQVGEYKRNYHSFGTATFFAFEQEGYWFALYSRDYTATRLMRLPDCQDIGGEEPCGAGFCPVEYLVPELTGQVIKPEDPEPMVANHDNRWVTEVGRRWYWPDDPDHPSPDEGRKIAYLSEKERSHAASRAWLERNPFVTQHARWGFVAGCVWGDDCSWKIQCLDLSRASEGIVKRDDRFGYIELPRHISLKQAIDVENIDVLNAPLGKQRIRIALATRFDLTGKRLED
jgi:hypothetical protein